MANRHTLHKSKLNIFKSWLKKDGWVIEQPKGIYEVMRARKAGRNNPLIVYTKANATEHFTVMDRDVSVLGEFIRDCRKPKTNADRIRSMSDEELAEYLPLVSNFICSPTQDCINILCNRGECTKTAECALIWLQSNAED